MITKPTEIKSCLYQDQKASGTNGGSSVAGWQTRVLNTEVHDDHSLGTLSSNAVTLKKGKYKVYGSAPAVQTHGHKLALYDGSSYVLIGSSEKMNSSNAIGGLSIVYGEIEADGSTAYSLRQYQSNARSSTGLGDATGSGQLEVYGILEFVRIGE
jgi:hypothetical protein